MKSTPLALAALIFACACAESTISENSANSGSDTGGYDLPDAGEDHGGIDTDRDGLSDAEEAALGTNPNLADSDGDGYRDGTEVTVGSDPTSADDACGVDEYEAQGGSRPVDIIFVIDNSSSMDDEIRSVENNVNENFADIIQESGVDFRVIMISSHAAPEDHHVCISEPLSGTDCNPIPAAPVNSDRFFHYDVGINSNDSFVKIIETFDEADMHGFAPNGWSQWLRPDAFKVFIEITDDNSEDRFASGASPTAENFDERLLALPGGQFGVPGFRNYIFHSIVGVEDNTPPTAPYLPDDPIVSAECDTARGAGQQYQRLSTVTGGLRYPVCRFESYDVVFEAAAAGVIQSARIACALRLPAVRDGEFIDRDAIAVEYREGNTQRRSLTRVPDGASCEADGFYVSGNTLQLCPTICAAAEAAEEAQLWVLAGCAEEQDECVPTGDLELACEDGIDNDCDGFTDRADVECIL